MSASDFKSDVSNTPETSSNGGLLDVNEGTVKKLVIGIALILVVYVLYRRLSGGSSNSDDSEEEIGASEEDDSEEEEEEIELPEADSKHGGLNQDRAFIDQL
jgi:hypothetical protein